ncbi:Putative yippee-like protein Os10g0369500 [Linum perenne]
MLRQWGSQIPNAKTKTNSSSLSVKLNSIALPFIPFSHDNSQFFPAISSIEPKELGILIEWDWEGNSRTINAMGRLFIEEVQGAKVFKCKCCKIDSASYDDIVSKDFKGRYGRAYLFRNVLNNNTVYSKHQNVALDFDLRLVNVTLGPTEERKLLSGLHVVNDIYCSSCQQILGWKYVRQILATPSLFVI